MRQRSRVTRTTATLASSAMLAAGLIALAPQAAQAAPGSQTFTVSGGLGQQFIVPSDVSQVTVTVKGGAGGLGGKEGGSGGRGGQGTFTMPVTPGDTIDVLLGKRGGDADPDNNTFQGLGGLAGGPEKGGNGGTGQNGAGAGGAGGGGTEVKLNGELVVVAAGGGGGGGRNAAFANDGGNGGNADADGADGSGPQADGGKVGDAGSEAGNTGDSAVNPGFFGGGGGGGGGGYQGGSGGDTNFGGSGAGGGGGRNYVDDSVATATGPWVSNVEKDGSVKIAWETQYATTVDIQNPGSVVTQELQGYTVNVTAAAPGQQPKGAVELSAENLGTGVVTALGTKNLVNGAVTIFSDDLLVGDYRLTATYTPNGQSDSLPSNDAFDFPVLKGDTSTLVAGPLDPPNFGDSVDLGVSVTATDPAQGIPSGQVKFFQGGLAIPGGTVTLDGDGKAVLTTTRLKVGTNDITANYLGDAEFNTSLDEVSLQNFVVNPGDVSIELTSVHNPVIAGEKSIFDVTVLPTGTVTDKPTGDVQLYVNEDPLGSPKPIDNKGKAHFEYELPVTNPDAHHHVTARYVGDSNFEPATSNFIDQIVNFGSAKVALSSDLNPSHVGNDVTFSIDVSGNLPTQPYEPTGEVQLYVNGSAFNGPVAIDGAGKATITTDDLPVGVNDVYAQYLGDAKYTEATSGILKQVVQKQLVAVTLVADQTDLQFGETNTLTASAATEKGDLATGFITFFDNGVQIGVPVAVDGNGSASLEIPGAGVDRAAKGTHQYSATYTGDDKTEDGTSNTVEVIVRANTLQFKLITSHIPAYEKQDILLHARLLPTAGSTGKLAGTVQYYTDGKKYGSPVQVSGFNWGSRVIRGLKPGTYRFTAKFLPSADSVYDGVNSAGVIQRVKAGKPNAKVYVTAKRTSPTTAVVKVKVRKTSGGDAPGYVQLYVNGVPVKLVKLSSGNTYKSVVLTGLPETSSTFLAANYRPNGKIKEAGKVITLYAF